MSLSLLFSSFFLSYIFKRGVEQEPVLQHAGFPPGVHSGKPENSPGSQEQFGLPAPTGVSFPPSQSNILSGVFKFHTPTFSSFFKILCYSFSPVWWCSWPETCRQTFIHTSPTFSSSSPPCWTPRTRRCWSGLSPASPTSTSTCGGSW